VDYCDVLFMILYYMLKNQATAPDNTHTAFALTLFLWVNPHLLKPGPITGKILRTIEDCENEVRAEVEAGMDTVNMSLDSEAH